MKFELWFKENVNDVVDIPPKIIDPKLLMVICRTWAECSWNYQQKIIDERQDIINRVMDMVEIQKSEIANLKKEVIRLEIIRDECFFIARESVIKKGSIT